MKFSRNLKSFLTDSSIYTFLNFLNKGIPFILLPIIIRIVSAEEYGKYSLFVTLQTLLVPLVSINIQSALSRHYYYKDFEKKEYLSTLIFSILCITFIWVLLSFFIPENLLHKFGFNQRIFALGVFSSGFFGQFALISNFFRLQRKPFHYGAFIIVQSFLLLSLVLFFGYWQPSSQMLIYGRVAFAIVFSFVIILYLITNNAFGLCFSFNWFRKALIFSLPTAFFSLFALVFSSSDRFFIQYFIGVEAVGRYAAIYQLASLISIFGMSLNAAWLPWLFENLKKKDLIVNKFIVKISFFLILVFIIGGLIYCLLFPFVAKIVLSPDYLPYIDIAYPIIMGFSFQGVYFIISPYIYYSEKTKFNAFIGLAIMVLNLILNYLFVPLLGMIGAAYSTFLTWLFLSISFFIFSAKLFPMPWIDFLKKNNHEIN